MNAETTVRRQLRARAWDVLSAIPEDFCAEGCIEERMVAGGFEIRLLLRRPGPPLPPPEEVLTLEPLQRWLPGMGLSDIERAIIAYLLEAGERRTQAQISADIRVGGKLVGDGRLKPLLARMTDPGVRILENDRSDKPPGYRVTVEYRGLIAWVKRFRDVEGVRLYSVA